MRAGQTAGGLVGRYGHYYFDGTIENLNLLPKRMKQVDKKMCIELLSEMIKANNWGLGVLGSTSLIPARKLQSYVAELF